MIWNPLHKKKNNFQIGIDIGTSSIKVVELVRPSGGNRAKLNNYGEFYAAGHKNAIQSRSLKILDSRVAEILKDVFTEAGISGKEAGISIPIFSSFSTLMTLPAMPDEELERAVRYEARKYIPVPINEVHFDWLKVDHLSTEKNFRILAVAVPNEIIEKYNRIAQLLNIKLTHIELETFSAARALLGKDQAPVLILDIGSRSTNISVVERGIVLQHHNIDVSGYSLTRVLSRGLLIDMQRAEALKRKNGVLPDGHAADLLYPLLDKIVVEIEKTLEEYVRQGGGKPMRIIMTGGSAEMPGLASYFQKSLKVKVEVGNPFNAIEVPKQLTNLLTKSSFEFTVAAGLALR